MDKNVTISTYFLWSTAFLVMFFLNGKRIENFKNSQLLLSYFLSRHTTFSQTQTCATVPLNLEITLIYVVSGKC